MPGNLLFADIAFPAVVGDDTKKDLKNVLNYLYMLREELRYTMGNIGVENFNDAELTDLSNIVTKGLSITVNSVEGSISQIIGRADETEASLTILSGYTTTNTNNIAAVQTQANTNGSNISLVVGSTRLVGVTGTVNASLIISTINSGTATIDAARINLVGYITATNLSTAGSTTINGSNITTGTISADRIDTSSLHVFKIYNPSSQLILSSITTTMYIGGDSGGSYMDNMYLLSGRNIYLGFNYSITYSLVVATYDSEIYGRGDWYLGTSVYYWAYAYIGKTESHIGNSATSRIGLYGVSPVTRQTVSDLSTSDTLATVISRFNTLLTALGYIGIIY